MANLVTSVLIYWRTVLIIVTPFAFLALPLREDTSEARCAYAILIMAVYWVTEALPIPVTALLPIVLFPLLEVVKVKEVSMAYFKDTNMVFFGSLIMAVSVEHSNLHKRIALRVLMMMGTAPKWIMLGFMLSTWFLSMWISNTATTAMMIPVATAVLEQLRVGKRKDKYGPDAVVEGQDNVAYDGTQDITMEVMDSGQVKVTSDPTVRPPAVEVEEEEDVVFCKILTLSVAYAANTGGIGTLTGTPPNLVLRNQAELEFDSRGEVSPISYARWMSFAIPVAAICLVIAWLWLVCLHVIFRRCFYGGGMEQNPRNDAGVKRVFREEYEKLGPLRFAEGLNIVLFGILIILWLTRDPGFVDGWGSRFAKGFVSDSIPAILVGIMLFILPSKMPACGKRRDALLDWQTLTRMMPWGPLFLLGGGFAMADACQKSGLSAMIGRELEAVGSLPTWVIVLVISAMVAAMTEVTSNTATTTILLPIVAPLAINIGLNPLYLMIPTTVAASYAFMLPVATAPNAIVFSYGHLRVVDMVLAGSFLNVVCVIVITVAVETWGKAIFNLDEMPWETDMTTVAPNLTTAFP